MKDGTGKNRTVKEAVELTAKAAVVLEQGGLPPDTPLLGPALVVLGLALSKITGEKETALRAIVEAGGKFGIVPDAGEAIAEMRADPRKFVSFARRILGDKVTVVEGSAPEEPLEGSPRRFPWR